MLRLIPAVGGTGEFGFYGHRMVIKVKVAELSPPDHVEWDEVSSTGGGFDGTTIGFDLTTAADVTSLFLRIVASRPATTMLPARRHVGASIS